MINLHLTFFIGIDCDSDYEYDFEFGIELDYYSDSQFGLLIDKDSSHCWVKCSWAKQYDFYDYWWKFVDLKEVEWDSKMVEC